MQAKKNIFGTRLMRYTWVCWLHSFFPLILFSSAWHEWLHGLKPADPLIIFLFGWEQRALHFATVLETLMLVNFWLHSRNKTGKDYGDVLSTMDLSLVLKTISTLQYQEWTQVHVASLTVLQLMIPHCVNVGLALGSRPCRVRRVFTFLMAIMLARCTTV